MSDPIRIGLIGASLGQSWASRGHLPALAALPQFKLTAVSTTKLDTAREAAERYGAPLAFDNDQELINHPDVEAVTVAVKVPEHYALVLKALDAGKHVYCEWPLGATLEQAVAMADKAREKGVRTAIGLQGRSSPWLQAIRDLVQSGALGQVLSTSLVASGFMMGAATTARSAFTLARENGASLLTISFGHTVDAVTHCLGDFAEISATLATQRKQVSITDTGETLPMTVADQIAVTGRLDGGAVAALHMRGGASRGTNFLWEINGTEGDLLVAALAGFAHYGALDLKLAKGADKALAEVPVDAAIPGVPEELKGTLAYNVAGQYAAFGRDIREGGDSCATFDDAVRLHRLLAAVERSDADGAREVLSGKR